MASSPPPPLSTPRPTYPNTIILLIRAAIALLPWLIRLSIANILLTVLLALKPISKTLVYNLSSLIAASVWTHIQQIFTWTNGARILVTGDSLPQGESAIVVSNHVEWSDFYMIQELALRANMLGRCRWFAKKELKWVPFLGWGLWAMGMPLVSRKWMQDERELRRVFDGVARRKWPIWLISFSESTRVTPQKRLQAASHASETNKPLPQHLLLPRTKGFATCVQHLRTAAPHVKAVYDLTVAYADLQPAGRTEDTTKNEMKKKMNGAGVNGNGSGHASTTPAQPDFTFQSPPTFLQSLFYPEISSRWRTLVHVRRFEISSLPEGEAELKAWLEERWVEKGELLEELRERLEMGEGWGNRKGE